MTDRPTDAVALPEDFVARLRQLIPADHLDAALASFHQHKPVAFRVNTLRAKLDATFDALRADGLTVSPLPWLPIAATVPYAQRALLTHHPLAEEGHLYIQNPASMLAPLMLDPRPGQVVLDLAAAPGGKTLQMAAMMEDQGQLSAVEPVKDRFFRLHANVRRHGASLVRLYQKDGRGVGNVCPDMFDRVMLDAPCSSEARMSTLRPESLDYWSPRKIKETSRKQRRLLESALRSLKPGGRLLYCTCAFSPEENELSVHDALKRHPSARVVPLTLPPEVAACDGLTSWQDQALNPALSGAKRVLPGPLLDGFFLCLLTREPDNALSR